MKTFLTTSLAVMILVGCGTTSTTDYESLLTTPPDELLVDCPIGPPPDPDVYLNTKEWEKKEEILFKALSDDQKESILCNTRINALRVWKKNQLEIYSNRQKKQ